MGFGIRFPGVRISTKGVRVGPRIANVKVGRGGIRASVGPSFARVSVGSRGVIVGSRVGPIGVSNRGVRISGGVGPVRASIGGGGYAELAAGPFWLGKGGRRRRQNSTSVTRSHFSSHTPEGRNLYGDSRARPNAVGNYREYMANLASSGVQRRNKFEIHDAAMQAWLMDMAPLVDLARPYPESKKPVIPALPDDSDIRKLATSELRDSASLSWWPPAREEAIRGRIAEVRGDLCFESAVLNELVGEAFTRFNNLDPAVNLIVLQASFADNAGTAAPIDLDCNHLLVLMSYPSVEDAIWPEVGVFEGKRFTVKKRNKTQTIERYRRNLMCHTAATAKEAFLVQPRLETVNVVVVPEFLEKRLATLPIILGAKFNREETLQVATLLDTSWIEKWDSCLEIWDSPQDGDHGGSGGFGSGFMEGFTGVSMEMPDPHQAAWENRAAAAGGAVSSFMEHASEIIKTANDTLNKLDDTWMFRISNQEGFKSIGVLGDLVPADVLDAAGGNDATEVLASPIGTAAHGPEVVEDCLFWAEALETAAVWMQEQKNNTEVNTDLTQQAPEFPDSFWVPLLKQLKAVDHDT